MDIVLLIGSLAIILIAAELFTNGIEWFGHRLNLAEGAVGSVLAAVATAMPETLIPVIAILGPVLFGGDPEASHAIGAGAILGAPFMLSTLAMFVTGVAVLLLRAHRRRGRPTCASTSGCSVATSSSSWSATPSPSAPPSCPAELAWVRWVAAGALFDPLRHLRAAALPAMPPEEGEPDALNQLHATRLPGMAGPHTLDIDILPGEKDSWEIDGAVARGCGSSSARWCWPWR